MNDRRYYIGPNGQRVIVQATSDRAERLVAWMLERGYQEVSEDEYLARNVRRNELVTYAGSQ